MAGTMNLVEFKYTYEWGESGEGGVSEAELLGWIALADRTEKKKVETPWAVAGALGGNG